MQTRLDERLATLEGSPGSRCLLDKLNEHVSRLDSFARKYEDVHFKVVKRIPQEETDKIEEEELTFGEQEEKHLDSTNRVRKLTSREEA